MPNVLYITSSSFSGSTLLSFLLNTHPDITTVGEMEGWKDADVNSFQCSCGAVLKTCPYFVKIAGVFEQHHLPFSPNDFGTGYRLVDNTRFNQYLTESLPRIRNTRVEQLRDWMLRHMPGFSKQIEQNNRANVLFMQTALALTGSKVFVDADKSPYRMRYLLRLSDINLQPLYLVRDPRGVVTTFMENRGWDAALAMKVWIKEQLDILRILQEFPHSIRIYYEDLCEDVNGVLAQIHRFAGVTPQPFSGDFQAAQHHILGNSMRLDRIGKIVKSERWKTKLSAGDQETIARIARDFIARHHGHPLSDILARIEPTK
jgi:hypothetical protein